MGVLSHTFSVNLLSKVQSPIIDFPGSSQGACKHFRRVFPTAGETAQPCQPRLHLHPGTGHTVRE